MDEAILNSLLRYSKQITPKRETYPIPSGSWHGSLRKSEAPINYSTYYLLDKPALSNSPTRPRYRLTSSASTCAMSPPKAFNKLSLKKVSQDPSTEPSRRITEPENDCKKVEEPQKVKNSREKRFFKSFDQSSSRKNVKENALYKKKNDEVDSLRKEIEKLKKEVIESHEKIRILEQSKVGK